MGNIFSIRLTDEDKIHLQQRMDETGKNATEVFKSAIYFTEIGADLVDEIISIIISLDVTNIFDEVTFDEFFDEFLEQEEIEDKKSRIFDRFLNEEFEDDE